MCGHIGDPPGAQKEYFTAMLRTVNDSTSRLLSVQSTPEQEEIKALAEDAPTGYEEALASADTHRETLVGPLLDALGLGIADPRGVSKEDAATVLYAG